MSKFEIKEKFYVNGKPLQIISGSIHYFRVVPEYWRDRLEKLKNMGCNTVETYIPWNFHEPVKGQFLWENDHDFTKFFQIAQELDLYIIVRPSPFICAEWEFGGLPAWLFKESGMKLRCSYEPYLNHVKDYYEQLIPRLLPYQIDNGGKIIMMQIENEYGYFGNDKNYLQYLNDLMRKLGVTVPFVTSDGPWGAAFKTGQVEGALPTGNFGSGFKKQFAVMKTQIDGEKPLMCMEFWAGWFDAWGNKTKMRSILKLNKADLEYALQNGYNVNFYMFHGGTNFGFMNGSNYYGKLCPDTTSYDYDAPLSEYGYETKKYWEFKKIIEKYTKVSECELTTDLGEKDRKIFAQITWNKKADLLENVEIISTSQKSNSLLSMECAGQNTGYIYYKTTLAPEEEGNELIFKKCADRVHCFVNDEKRFTAYDKEIATEGHGMWPFNYKEGKVWKINAPKGSTIQFLVENLGRVNFGHKLEEQKKGITEDVIINGHCHFGWENYTLPLDESQIELLQKKGKWTEKSSGDDNKNPAFFRFDFKMNNPVDTALNFKGWGKGCVFVNGFNIGRFWKIGPQKELYIPAPLLKNGENTIIIFETEGIRKESVELISLRKRK